MRDVPKAQASRPGVGLLLAARLARLPPKEGQEEGGYDPGADHEQLPDSKEAEAPGKRTVTDAAGGVRQRKGREVDEEEIKRARRLASGANGEPAIFLLNAARQPGAKAQERGPKESASEEKAPFEPTRETQYALESPATGAGTRRSQPY